MPFISGETSNRMELIEKNNVVVVSRVADMGDSETVRKMPKKNPNKHLNILNVSYMQWKKTLKVFFQEAGKNGNKVL